MKPTPAKPRIIIAQVEGSGTAATGSATENSICFTSLKPPVLVVVTKIDLMMSPSMDHPPKLAKSVFAAMEALVPVKTLFKISVIVSVTVPAATKLASEEKVAPGVEVGGYRRERQLVENAGILLDVRKTVSNINQHGRSGTRDDVGQLGCMIPTDIHIKRVDVFVALSESHQFRDACRSSGFQTENEAGLTSTGRRNKSRATQC